MLSKSQLTAVRLFCGPTYPGLKTVVSLFICLLTFFLCYAKINHRLKTKEARG